MAYLQEMQTHLWLLLHCLRKRKQMIQYYHNILLMVSYNCEFATFCKMLSIAMTVTEKEQGPKIKAHPVSSSQISA